MISDTFIKDLAEKLQTTELNVRREYCQHLFLFYFYKQENTDGIYFKGGTALRILYRSPRFSEDLDFSAAVHTSISLEPIILDTLARMEKEGIYTEIAEAKTTTGGYLAIIIFQWNGHHIPIRLKISFRKERQKGAATTITGDFMPPYTITHLAPEQLVEGKLSALFSRKKPRDFYDLYFLLRANLISPPQRKLLRDIPAFIKKSLPPLEKELKEFLPKSHWPVLKNLGPAILREVTFRAV